MTSSPDNLHIGKGIVSFKKDGDAEYRDLGNVTAFTTSPVVEELEHYSSREGVRSLDKTVILSKKVTVKMTLEEYMLENLQLALNGGELQTDDDGRSYFLIQGSNAVTGALRLMPTNEVGPQLQIDFPSVSFKGGTEVPFIGEDWSSVELEGTAQISGGEFGRVTDINSGSTAVV